MKNWVVLMMVGVGWGSWASEGWAFGGKRPPVDEVGGTFEVGEISLGGSGCAGGATVVNVSKTGKSIGIEFQEYDLSTSESLVRKNCAAVIPILNISEGHQVVLKSLSLSGKVDMGEGSTGKVSAEAFLAGEKGEVLNALLQAGDHGDQVLVSGVDLLRTGCGQSEVVLRVNTSVWIKGGESQVMVDDLKLKLDVVPCSEE